MSEPKIVPENFSEADKRARAMTHQIDLEIGSNENIQTDLLLPNHELDQRVVDSRLDQLSSQIDETLAPEPVKQPISVVRESRIIKPSTGPKTPLTPADVDSLQANFGSSEPEAAPIDSRAVMKDIPEMQDLLVEAVENNQHEVLVEEPELLIEINDENERTENTRPEQEPFNPTQWYNQTIIHPFNYLDDKYSHLLEQSKSLPKEQLTTELFHGFKGLNELLDRLHVRAQALAKEFNEKQEDLELAGNDFTNQIGVAYRWLKEIEQSISVDKK